MSLMKIVVNENEVSINGIKASLPKDIEPTGCRPKYWIRSSEGFDYLIKKPRGKDTFEHVGEVIFSNICQKMDIDSVIYSLVESHEGNEPPLHACFCRSYKAKSADNRLKKTNTSDNEISGANLQESHTTLFKTSKKNFTIDEYKQILDDMYPNSEGYKGKEQAITHLTKMTILDYLTMQPDRHASNISFFTDSTPGRKNVASVPVFDSGNIFGLSYSGKVLDKLMESTTQLHKQGVYLKEMEKHNKPPVLGISTSFNDKGLKVFESELADKIIASEELKKFYSQARQVDIAAAFTPDVKEVLGDRASNIEAFASIVYTTRTERLDSIIKEKLTGKLTNVLKKKSQMMRNSVSQSQIAKY